MIESVVEKWHAYMRGELPGGLDELLDDDVTFFSPIVFTPQRGKAVTKLYLQAASQTFPGKPPDAGDTGAGDTGAGDAGGAETSRFGYTRQVLSGNTAVLEFETLIDSKYVNGIDLIVCNEVGKIVEFRVMIRPLQAVNVVHAQMKAALERLQQPAASIPADTQTP